MVPPRKHMGIAEFARAIEQSEGAVRRLHSIGVVHPARDPWNRRIFGPDDEAAARRYLAQRRARRRDYSPTSEASG